MGEKIVYPIVNIEKMRKLKRKKQDYKMNLMVLVYMYIAYALLECFYLEIFLPKIGILNLIHSHYF